MKKATLIIGILIIILLVSGQGCQQQEKTISDVNLELNSFFNKANVNQISFRIEGSKFGHYGNEDHSSVTYGAGDITCREEFIKTHNDLDYIECYIESIGPTRFECETTLIGDECGYNYCHTNAYIDCLCYYRYKEK